MEVDQKIVAAIRANRVRRRDEEPSERKRAPSLVGAEPLVGKTAPRLRFVLRFVLIERRALGLTAPG
ncbi:hypothetical protein [Sorangium sp. So ce128]|uniref:hypothetical protein n=1 Tax=Sorangium sp. So ce128 TaxID=3133281 RepID=UPI003F6009D5